MRTKIHAIAGGIGFLTILIFWTSTVFSEIFGSPETIAVVKDAIAWGLLILIPSLAVTGASGMSLGISRGKGRTDALVLAKKKRMPIIAGNGLIVLIPCALFLAGKADAGVFDAAFFAVQGLELIAGGVNLALMAMNIRGGLIVAGRIPR